MANRLYSDDVKSAICGVIFAGGVLGFLIYDTHLKNEASRIYDKVNSSISLLDGRQGTSLGDWNILYQKVLGRELNLGEHPRYSGLADLLEIETKLPQVIRNDQLSNVK